MFLWRAAAASVRVCGRASGTKALQEQAGEVVLVRGGAGAIALALLIVSAY